MSTIASAGQDGKVFVWAERPEGASPAASLRGEGGFELCCLAAALPGRPRGGSPRGPEHWRHAGGWDRHLLHDFGAPVWRVSWSVSGGLLSVSDANNAVTLWKEAADGQWQQVTQ